MLADGLIERAKKCAEMQGKLDADPGNKNAGDWISAISQNALSRNEERHVAVVRAIAGLRRRISAIETSARDDAKLKDHAVRLKERIASMPAGDRSRGRFEAKLASLESTLAVSPRDDSSQIPLLRKRIADLSNSDSLITKEDVLNG